MTAGGIWVGIFIAGVLLYPVAVLTGHGEFDPGAMTLSAVSWCAAIYGFTRPLP